MAKVKKVEEKAVMPPAAPTLLQSRDISARVEPDEPRLRPAERGPVVGQVERPIDYIARHATAAELTQLEAAVRRRVEADVPVALVCDNPRCRMFGTFKKSTVGTPCVKCNWGQYREGGHMRIATPAEVEFYQEKIRRENLKIRRQAEAAALYRENKERQEQGLQPIGMAEFREAIQRRLEKAPR